jgi:iron complex transport system ATP-binding protein
MKLKTLEVRHLSLGYGQLTVPVISGMDLNIPPGKITALIGPNGCGKSTLLKGLARILKPLNGAAYLNGAAIHQLPTMEVARELGVLSQGPSTPEGLTVLEIVSLGRYPYHRGWSQSSEEDRQAVEEAIEIAGLQELAYRPMDTLSGGQRQRAWIAMALAQRTSILLLDEPTTFLDVAHQLEVLDLLWNLNREENRTIVMVLHDLNQASRYADHLVMLKGGKVFIEGSPAEVVCEENIQAVFGVACRVIIDPEIGSPFFIPLSSKERLAS